MTGRDPIPQYMPPIPDWGPFIAEDIVSRRLLYRMGPACVSDWAMAWFPWATADQILRGVSIAVELTVADGEVRCVARVLHAGRRSLVVEAEVRQGYKLVAKGQGTFAQL